ncbi:MAG: hypothetical protein NZ516_04515 [Raineya sp.]|nr:hypothetical protein [Raineya sp.]
MKVQAQSIARFGEQENEDSFKVQENERVFLLADGAGGLGLFAREWAEWLTQQIPPTGSREGFLQFLWEQKVSFYEQREKFLQNNSVYEDFADKFFLEGSASTLLVADGRKEGKIKLISYGDSGIFLYKRRSKELITNLQLSHFVELPVLINCLDKDLQEEYLFWQEVEWCEGDCLLLVSDALAQYFRLVYAFERQERDFLEALKKPKTAISAKVAAMEAQNHVEWHFEVILQELEEVLQDTKSFRDYCYFLWKGNFLEYDDYTAILVRK